MTVNRLFLLIFKIEILLYIVIKHTLHKTTTIKMTVLTRSQTKKQQQQQQELDNSCRPPSFPIMCECDDEYEYEYEYEYDDDYEDDYFHFSEDEDEDEEDEYPTYNNIIVSGIMCSKCKFILPSMRLIEHLDINNKKNKCLYK